MNHRTFTESEIIEYIKQYRALARVGVGTVAAAAAIGLEHRTLNDWLTQYRHGKHRAIPTNSAFTRYCYSMDCDPKWY